MNSSASSRSHHKNIAGIPCDFISHEEFLEYISSCISPPHMRGSERGSFAHIVTLNAEMVVEAQHNTSFKQAIEQAELVIPDGSSLLWAKRYTSRHPGPRAGIQARRHGFRVPTSLASFAGRSKPGMTNLVFSLINHLFSKDETLTGVDSVFDICAEVEKHNGSVYLLGGTEEEASGTKQVLQKKYPKLRVIIPRQPHPTQPPLEKGRGTQHLPLPEGEMEGVGEIVSNKPTALFVAYGSPKQTLWIEQNRKALEEAGVKIAVGVGGAFSIISGILPRAPKILRRFHLEWLWRLFLQPWRIKRIWNAVVVFPRIILSSKTK